MAGKESAHCNLYVLTGKSILHKCFRHQISHQVTEIVEELKDVVATGAGLLGLHTRWSLALQQDLAQLRQQGEVNFSSIPAWGRRRKEQHQEEGR